MSRMMYSVFQMTSFHS